MRTINRLFINIQNKESIQSILRRPILAILFSLIGFISIMPISAETTVGVIPGEFSGGGGGGVYSIPLQTAPGIMGLQPRLSVTYNSNRDQSGLMGVGFSLGGVPAVSRCGATTATDDYRGGVDLSTRDRLCFKRPAPASQQGHLLANGPGLRIEPGGQNQIYFPG